jgi:hypothetical protein
MGNPCADHSSRYETAVPPDPLFLDRASADPPPGLYIKGLDKGPVAPPAGHYHSPAVGNRHRVVPVLRVAHPQAAALSLPPLPTDRRVEPYNLNSAVSNLAV